MLSSSRGQIGNSLYYSGSSFSGENLMFVYLSVCSGLAYCVCVCLCFMYVCIRELHRKMNVHVGLCVYVCVCVCADSDFSHRMTQPDMISAPDYPTELHVGKTRNTIYFIR